MERKLKKLKGYIDNEEIVWFDCILAWEMEKVVYFHRKKGMYPNAVCSIRLAKKYPLLPRVDEREGGVGEDRFKRP